MLSKSVFLDFGILIRNFLSFQNQFIISQNQYNVNGGGRADENREKIRKKALKINKKSDD
jgi:hypothetical protein